MSTSINSIKTSLLNGPRPFSLEPQDGEGKVRGFQDMLKDAVSAVNERMNKAEDMSTRLTLGEPLDIADVMTAMTKASISFQLLTQVRNKALSAYEEIMRMQV